MKARADGAATEVATLKANQFDAAKHVPVETHQLVSTELATLKATISKAEVSALVEDALKSNKAVPAQKVWLETLSVDQLKSFLKDAPAVVPGSTQSQGKGNAVLDTGDTDAVTLKAQQYMTEQAALGRAVGSAEAVAHVIKASK
jgi:phage I-like protein